MARRGRRRITGLTVVLLILVALFVGGDRAGAWAAERTIAGKVSQEMDQLGVSASEPDVTVAGFPFLTQVLDGRYDEIRVLVRDVSARGVTVPELDIRATDVRAEMNTLLSGDGSITADRVSGTATIGYSSVRAMLDRPGLQVAGQDGKVRLRVPVTVAGISVTAIALGEVTVADGRIRVEVTDIRADGVQLPPPAQGLLDAYKSQLSVEMELPPLPMQLRIEGVQATSEGIAVTASAAGVPLSG